MDCIGPSDVVIVTLCEYFLRIMYNLQVVIRKITVVIALCERAFSVTHRARGWGSGAIPYSIQSYQYL